MASWHTYHPHADRHDFAQHWKSNVPANVRNSLQQYQYTIAENKLAHYQFIDKMYPLTTTVSDGE